MTIGWRRGAAAAVVVLGVYMGLALLNSPRGFLGTDTGGKVATFEAMSERGRFDPDLGYWAERWDPDGRLQPIAYTSHTTSGKWVNVTTLPALWVGWPLYDVGGYRLSLLVPMAGSLAAAFAGLALLRRLGVPADGGWAWGGFGVLALASPLTIYALDFWEHSVGVALLAWGVVVLCDAVTGAVGWWWRVAVAGLLFGGAATMRTEALVYLAVAGLAATLLVLRGGRAGLAGAGVAGAGVAGAGVGGAGVGGAGGPLGRVEGPLRRADGPLRRAGGALVGGSLLLVAAAVPLVVNEVVERRVVGSTIRATRVLGTAASVGDLPADRAREAAVTLVGLEGSDLGIALGVLSAALLVYAATRTDAGLAVVATAIAGGLLVVRAVAGGLGFVPGLLAAWVLPASSAPFGRAHADMPASARPDVRRLVLAVALGAAPIVLATQFRGGAGPQWAGRYLLTSGLLLAVVGWSALATSNRRPLAGAAAALAVATTAFGLLWLQVRSHDVERTIAALEARPEPVLVSDVFHLAREGGATFGDTRWLTLTDRRTDAPLAAEVLTEAGIDTFASVEPAARATGDRLDFPGFEPTDHSTIRLFDGVDLTVTSWRTTP